MASHSIAFIGTGVMGRSMAGHLQKAGHTLHVREVRLSAGAGFTPYSAAVRLLPPVINDATAVEQRAAQPAGHGG